MWQKVEMESTTALKVEILDIGLKLIEQLKFHCGF